MNDWPYSVVLLIPAARQAAGNQIAAGIGHGPYNFSVALSPNGNEPATWYGCRSQCQQSFVDLLAEVGGGVLPIIEGMTPQQIGAALMQLHADIAMEDGYTHFERVIAEQGLMRVEEAII